MSYNVAAIHELLEQALTENDLNELCFLHFKPVFRQFVAGMDLAERQRRLLAYVETRGEIEIERLLAEIQKINPDRYAIYDPRIHAPSPAQRQAANPYRGLEVFGEEHAAVYFGREEMVTRLLDKLNQRTFVAVVGPSGSGKSSLVQAGLGPALRANRLPGSQTWRVDFFRPGEHPLRALAIPLMAYVKPQQTAWVRLTEAPEVAHLLGSRQLDLAFLLSQAPARPARFILVADQFEEAFTLCRDEALRRRFFDLLLRAADVDGLTILLTVRADFSGHLLAEPGLGQRADEGWVNVLAMTPAEQRAAIERPAQARGARLEDGLSDHILRDLAAAPGQLPLLEFALQQLWAQQTSDSLLTHAAYDALGGLSQALGRHAEAVFNGLDADAQAQAPDLFTRLVRVTHPEEGGEDTRRRLCLDELPAGLHGLALTLAGQFQRLLVTDRDAVTGAATVEMVHETLIRHWPRLRGWLDADRAFLLWRQRLQYDRQRWQESRDPDTLLRGGPLVEAERWFAARPQDWTGAELAYLAACRAQRAADEARRREQIEALNAANTATQKALRMARARELAAHAMTELEHLTDSSGSLALMLAREAVLRARADGDPPPVVAQDALQRTADTATTFRLRLAGHAARVMSAAFSPDGRLIVTAGDDGTTRVWDAITGQEVRQLAGDGGSILSATFSPDGRLIATADIRTARVWDAETGQVVRHLAGDAGSFFSAAFSPDGRLIVTAGIEGTAWVWDAATGAPMRELVGHAGGLLSAAFSPDGRLIVTASKDATARVWDAATGATVRVLAGHTASVLSAAFSPDGRLIVTGSDDHTARVFDATTGQEVRVLIGHTASIGCAAFSHDGRLIVTASKDGTARVWDAATGAPLRPLAGHAAAVWSAAFSPDGRLIVTASADGTARVWDVAPGQETRQLTGHAARLRSAAFSPHGRLILTSSDDRTARIWDEVTGREVRQLSGHAEAVLSAAFSPDGQLIVTASADRTTQVWDTQTGATVRSLAGHTARVWSAAFSPDGRLIVTGSDDGASRIWNVATGQEVRQLAGPADGGNFAAFSPDGRLIVTAGSDRMARVWEAETGAAVWSFAGHTARIWCAAFSSDGRLIATASEDRTARIWDVVTGEEVRQLTGHAGAVWSAAFSPDGQLIATASGDGTARVWDAATGQELRRLTGHAAGVYGVAFSPDGRRIVTASEDRTALVWLVSIDELLAQAEAHIQRDPPRFTSAERQRYGLDEM